jgi:hypothetical protein
MLLDDIFDISKKDLENIFSQIIDVVIKLWEIKFDDFGLVNSHNTEYCSSYSNYLIKDFDSYVSKIKSEKICPLEDISKIENYFKKHISIFDK